MWSAKEIRVESSRGERKTWPDGDLASGFLRVSTVYNNARLG